MDRYTFGFLILCGWFVVFRMFPARIGDDHRCPDPSLLSSNFVSREPKPQPDSTFGEVLFMANCSSCHDVRLEKPMTAPALFGVSNRIPQGDWIYNWVHNSPKLIESGDAYAVKVYIENTKISMTTFPELSNSDIDSIMAFIDGYNPPMH